MFEFTLNYLVPVIIGCLIGVVTGLTPGLHVNTIAIIGLSLFPSLNISFCGYEKFPLAEIWENQTKCRFSS